MGKTRLGELGRSARQAAVKQRLVPPAAAPSAWGVRETAPGRLPLGQDGLVHHDTLGAGPETAGGGAPRRFLSSVGSELNGIAQQTSSLLSNVFGEDTFCSGLFGLFCPHTAGNVCGEFSSLSSFGGLMRSANIHLTQYSSMLSYCLS